VVIFDLNAVEHRDSAKAKPKVSAAKKPSVRSSVPASKDLKNAPIPEVTKMSAVAAATTAPKKNRLEPDPAAAYAAKMAAKATATAQANTGTAMKPEVTGPIMRIATASSTVTPGNSSEVTKAEPVNSPAKSETSA